MGLYLCKEDETPKEVLDENRLRTYLEKESWWWNEEVQEELKKKVTFKKWQRTRTNEYRDEYRTLNKSAKAEVAKKHAINLHRGGKKWPQGNIQTSKNKTKKNQKHCWHNCHKRHR